MRALLLLLSALSARADSPVGLSYFEDKSASLTAEQVVEREAQLPWTEVTGPTARFGYTDSRVWLRLSLPPASELPAREPLLLEIPSAYNERVGLFTVSKGRITHTSLAGMGVPLRDREGDTLATGFPTFRLMPPHTDERTLFASIESKFPLSFPVRLMPAAEFAYYTFLSNLLFGVFLGVLCLAFLSNGFLALSLRSSIYGSYAMFVAFLTALYLAHRGLTIQLFWGNSPWWAIRELDVYGGLALFFYVCFVREFLGTRRNTPWLDRLLLALLAVSTARSLWILVHPYRPVQMAGQIAVTLTNLLVMVIAAKAWHRGVRTARYFLAAAATFNVGLVLFVLQEANFFWIGANLEWAPIMGSLAEVALLSFALGDRIRQTNAELVQQRIAMVRAEKLGALGRMAGEIAHEINNPLAIIQGNATLLRGLDTTDQVRDFAGTIELTAKRISNVVRGMRALARDTRQDPFQSTPLSAILQDTLLYCRERARDVSLRVESPPQDLTLRCRSSEICQVLVNLLNNSFDAVEGLPSPWVRLEAVARGGVVELAVCDSGLGVPKEMRARIQEPFFTTKEAGKGLGLGLSISRTIVESHGGTLWLDEKSPHTRFVFTVPVWG